MIKKMALGENNKVKKKKKRGEGDTRKRLKKYLCILINFLGYLC